MGKKGRETTEEERRIIIRLHNQCKSLSQISRIVSIPQATIQHIIDRFGERKSLKNRRRRGCLRKLNEVCVRTIFRKVNKNPHISAPKIASELQSYLKVNVCAGTVRNYLRLNAYHGRISRRKYYINDVNRKKRLEFAKKNITAPQEFWNRCIFTDQSKFNIFSSDGRSFVWRQKNTELRKENLKPTVKHGGGSVLVWGCMSASGVGSLHFIEGNLDQHQYIEILKSHLHSSAEKVDIKDSFVFTQDNDPKHTALNTRLWILYNTPKYLQTPPQSPDINPIEHLWDYLDKKLRARHVSNKRSLQTALEEEWNKIPQSLTTKLVDSMQRRLQTIIDAKGYPTKY